MPVNTTLDFEQKARLAQIHEGLKAMRQTSETRIILDRLNYFADILRNDKPLLGAWTLPEGEKPHIDLDPLFSAAEIELMVESGLFTDENLTHPSKTGKAVLTKNHAIKLLQGFHFTQERTADVLGRVKKINTLKLNAA